MLLGGGARPVRGTDNLTALYEPNVYKMWDPQHLTTLQASTALAAIGDSARGMTSLELRMAVRSSVHWRRVCPSRALLSRERSRWSL
jgi:hypothetical protein